jgi:hypothetical protein
MSDLVLQPTSTAQWRALVDEAQSAAHYRLDEELESYLVFLLMRFARTPQVLVGALAEEYLESQLAKGGVRRERLREVGDRCLLFSGLFPHLARRRCVTVSYYATLGQGAYAELSRTLTHRMGELYAQLARTFVSLMDVLQWMRRMHGQAPLLDPLQAFDLWANTGSAGARHDLQAITGSMPIIPDTDTSH